VCSGGRGCFVTVGIAGAAASFSLATTQKQQQQQQQQQQGNNLFARLHLQQTSEAEQFEAGLQHGCYGTQ
jgi:Tfp pilus assembly protein PilV